MADVPVPGDFDGDGTLDTAFWRPSEGNWFIQPSSGGQQRVVQFGQDGDIPVPTDYDHDGKVDLAVWRPGEHTLRVRPSSGVPDWSLLIPQDGEVLRPENHGVLNLFAYALYSMTLRLKADGQPDKAATAARESIRVFLGLTKSPGELDPTPFLARLVELPDYLPASEAVAPTQDAVALLRTLVATDPANLDHQSMFAYALYSMTLRLKADGQPDKAATAARESIRVFLGLTKSPGELDPTPFLARLVELPDYLPASEAVAPTQDAVALLRTLVATDPANLDHQSMFAYALYSLTLRLKADGQPDKAATAARESIRVFLGLTKSPGELDPTPFLARLVELPDYLPASEAVAPTQDAVALLRTLVATDPANLDHQSMFAYALHSLTLRLKADGQPDKAAAAEAQAMAADHQVAALRTVLSVLDSFGYTSAGGTTITDLLHLYGTVWNLALDGRTFNEQLAAVTDHVEGRFCAVSDAVDEHGGLRPLTYGAPGGRWLRTALTFSINSNNAGPIQPADVGLAISAALMAWQSASGFLFSFQPVPAGGDIQVSFGDSGLNTKFGKAGDTAGSAGYPGSPHSGQVHFDSAELWTRDSLTSVAIHEIGHALGLSHSNNPNSVMYPISPPALMVDAESRDALNNLYGWSPQELLTDRGTSDRPALAVAGQVHFTSSDEKLRMVWRGIPDDDSLFESELVGNEWTPQQPIQGAFGSKYSPALTAIPVGDAPSTGLLMAWRGIPDDDSLYWSMDDGTGWTAPTPTPDVGSNDRPSLATFSVPHMAWQGIPGDDGIYWSRFTSGEWEPQKNIRGVGTSGGPSLVQFQDRLYIFWKGIEGDSNIYYSWFDDANPIWRPQQTVWYADTEVEGGVPVNVGTSDGPSATVHGNRILLAWKGIEGDAGIYFSFFDGKEFTGQINVRGVGTSRGPAVCTFNGTVHMVWQGVEGDDGIYWSRL
ncbi:matrixin family metalloprotease [Streptomyces sp. NBC_00117]|uniref:matrixin family metalloprotease n=1 Tax=Streptomyces sp. NBC_00117 TaxID=2975657 RepID=UPI00324C5F53